MSTLDYFIIALIPFALFFLLRYNWILGKRSFQKFDLSKQYFVVPVDENYSSTTSIDWNSEFGHRFAVLQKKGLYWNKTYAIIEGKRIDLLLNNHASLCNLVTEILKGEKQEMTQYALKSMVTK